jgi:hypothetical protein
VKTNPDYDCGGPGAEAQPLGRELQQRGGYGVQQ